MVWNLSRGRLAAFSVSMLMIGYTHICLILIFPFCVISTLAAADNAVMLVDAGKGLEPQTRKLFEVGAHFFVGLNNLNIGDLTWERMRCKI